MCLDNLVAVLPSVNPTKAIGVLYVNSLGVTLDMLNKANDGSFTDGQDFFNEVLALAQDQISTDIASRVTYRPSRRVTLLNNGTVGYYKENKQEETSGSLKQGIYFEVPGGQYQKIFLQSIDIFATEAVDTTLSIIDFTQEKVLDTVAFTSVAGEIATVNINKSYGNGYNVLRLGLAYEGSEITPYKSYTSPNDCASCRRGRRYVDTAGTYIAGFKQNTAGLKMQNIERGSTTYGLRANYSVECTTEAFVCNLRESLQYPLLYLTASMLLDRMINSLSNSTAKNFNSKHLAAKSQDYRSTYELKMFGAFDEAGNQTSKGLLDNIMMPDNRCFCNQPKISSGLRV